MSRFFGLVCLVYFIFSQIPTNNGARTKPAKKSEGVTPLIIQGTAAVLGQFPHQANLEIISARGSVIRCGGSLISPRWLLTAAHCVAGMNQVITRLGSIDFNSTEVLNPTTTFFIHPNYNPTNLNNDIALVNLEVDVTITSSIRPIRLPSTTQARTSFAGQQATVSGWGYTTNTGPVSNTLNFLVMNVITNNRCRQNYSSPLIIASTLCATGTAPAQGICFGDSGGPLIFREADGLDTLIGVVSFVSSSGCDSNYPSAFARVSSFLNWISQRTGIPIRT